MNGAFTIPDGMSFVEALAAGIIARHGDKPEHLADVLVLVPTRRSARSLRDGFLRQSGGRALILPTIQPIGDVDEDDLTVGLAGDHLAGSDLPPAIAPLRRQLLLTRRIRADTEFGTASDEQAAQLANALASFIDEVDTAEADLGRLDTLVEAELSEHWQKTLRFLTNLTDAWHHELHAEDRMDPAARRRALLDRLGRLWETHPPSGPVIAAGSTGSIPATARLLAGVLALPLGAVVLPGLDQDIDERAWNLIEDSHPQHSLKALLDRLGLERDQVLPWPVPEAGNLPLGSPARRKLLSDALLPPDADPSWTTDESPLPEATDGLEFLGCANPREEAQVAALRMRIELEQPGRTVALVTRDRVLARRVAADLKRWSIEVDDSAGQALAATPAGTFFRLVARAMAARWAPVPLLAMLKHPFLRLGRDAADVRNLIRALELAVLRGPRPAAGLEGLRRALADHDNPAELMALLDDLGTATGDFDQLLDSQQAPLLRLIGAHAATLENLARSTEDSRGSIWQDDDGEALHGFVAEMLENADALGFVTTDAYPALLETLLEGRIVRPRYGRHPRAFIWGPLEARMQHADCVILAGLVEGSWPPEPPNDPWLSRPMRTRFGLATPEQRIGLAAHDFVQAASAQHVLLLYPERSGGAPTVPARWLVRLRALLDAHGLSQRPHSDATVWQRWQSTLDRPPAVEPAQAPHPTPEPDARPKQLSVTQIETWQRDPYAIYARHILGLRPLDELDEDADAATRGSFIHEALERFVVAWPDTMPENSLDLVLGHGRDILGTMLERPVVATFWWRRFERVAAWFVEEETRRRGALARVEAERRGELAFDDPRGGQFVLTAKADRLERRSDGQVTIVDYKTGGVPAKKHVVSGQAPQLPLEAAMIRAGAFPDLGEAEVSGLEYWKLSGGEPAGKVDAIKEDPAEIADSALAGLKRLVEAFAQADTAYLDHPAGAPIGPFDAYTDIARTKEWRLGWRTLLDDVLYGNVPESRTPKPRSSNRRQQAMSDPQRTVWVAASAGTGKTKVLTDRVLRLLLGGSKPSRILCLTFTRAAAAEMANRIRYELAGWAAMDDANLIADLTALTGNPPEDESLARARQLFATVLEAPGGLQIATIHSFCQSLLGRFPLEAGIAPHFTLIEERARGELLRDARDRVIGAVASGRAPKLEEALDRLILEAGEARASDLLGEICGASDAFDRMLNHYGSLDHAIAALALGLRIEPTASQDSLIAAACRDGLERDALGQAAQALAHGSKTDLAAGETIAAFLKAPEGQRPRLLDGYASVFLKADKQPRAKGVGTKKVRENAPESAEALDREQIRLEEIYEMFRALGVFERSRAILVLGSAILEVFRGLKRGLAVLDYDDMIGHARKLLTTPGIAPWVLYKLDGGLDHVLVDEAQDTNPGQWDVVLALTEEFFSDQENHESPRTLFVVGDEKQSIFSFQGADLQALQNVRAHLQKQVATGEWYSDSLDLSYRSVPAILDAVDTVFAAPEAAAGVAFDGQTIHHEPHRADDGGLVEVWPPLSEEPAADEDPWASCLNPEQPHDHHAQLAGAIAARIAAMTGDDDGPGELLASRGDMVRAGDVLILVRRRSALVPAMVRELRRAGVAVAGVDRMDLTGEIVVRDLLALGRGCLLPGDDVSLAAVLKGPLVGFSEALLFDLARHRGREGKTRESLWSALRHRRDDHEAYGRAAAWLERLLGRTDFSAPFEFYDEILTMPAATAEGFNGRKALIHRLGLEAQDPLDEFLNL
ncbi:MAG: double-strand break repair protein AddB, partial [Rhodospirillaceae bacterium]|nr:double-strand break repair protein AddB [Rhodospirillaceae bacterium]